VTPRLTALRLAVAAAVMALPACGEGSGAVATETVRIRQSAFVPAVIEVRAGQPLRLLLDNTDPIDHEWIVGDEATHAAHRTGTEPYHAARPTEVSIEAGRRRMTTVAFEQPGKYRFVCHLPGHEAYGMTGVLRVVP
jgi:uncharacterized cupredoxin-like copper-binding protein